MKQKLGSLALAILVAAILFAAGYYVGNKNASLPYGFSWNYTTIVGEGSQTEDGEDVHGFLLIDNNHNKKYLVCDDGTAPTSLNGELPNE